MSSYGEKFNGNICPKFVIDGPSMEEFWLETYDPVLGAYAASFDPTNSAINKAYSDYEMTLEEEQEAEIAELEAGDVQGVARCRALYDWNY